MAEKAGLKIGDLVVKINDDLTSHLNNEQLRNLMRQRLQMNSVQCVILSVDKQDALESTTNNDHKSESSKNSTQIF